MSFEIKQNSNETPKPDPFKLLAWRVCSLRLSSLYVLGFEGFSFNALVFEQVVLFICLIKHDNNEVCKFDP